MKNLLKLVIPEKIEILLYICISVSLLVIQSIKPIKGLIEASSDASGVSTQLYQSNLTIWANNLLNKIDPRLIDFLVWVLVGSLVFVMASIMIASVKSAAEEVHFLNYYRSPKGKHHEVNVLLTKVAIRLFGLSALIIWFLFLASYLNSVLTNIFFTSLIFIKQPVLWIWTILTIMAYALSLYLFAVLIRIIFLKIRVFSNQEE